MQDQTLPPLDKEGYLIDLSDWNRVIAEQLANAEDIALSQAHWQIIDLLRGVLRPDGYRSRHARPGEPRQRKRRNGAGF